MPGLLPRGGPAAEPEVPAGCPFPGGLPGQILVKTGHGDCVADWKNPSTVIQIPPELKYASSLNNVMLQVTVNDILRGYIDLDHCIDVRKIDRTILTLNTNVQYYGLDYHVTEDDEGNMRRIVFGPGLLNIPIKAGDLSWIIFHEGECGFIPPEKQWFELVWFGSSVPIGTQGIPLGPVVAGPVVVNNFDTVIAGTAIILA